MSKKNIVLVAVMALVIFIGQFEMIPVYASERPELVENIDSVSYSNMSIVPYAGTETLPMGEYYIGGFTFTNNNLTPRKTMPAGASKWSLNFKFRKATSDAGIGQVKLTYQIRRSDGVVVSSGVINDNSGEYSVGPYYRRYSEFNITDIPVRPGQVYQIWTDASSVNPSQSNGNYRSIQIIDIKSYIQ